MQKKSISLPRKRDFRMRAHINPLQETTFGFPNSILNVNYSQLYPKFANIKDDKVYGNTLEYPILYDKTYTKDEIQKAPKPDFVDIGCGFGGLLFELSKHFPGKLTIGMEIRDKLVNFINQKIQYYRQEDKCHNISALRTNTQRHFLQYFQKESLSKVFVLFPDPHFKAKQQRRRIVSTGFLTEYAYCMKKGARIYCITDVEELHQHHVEQLKIHSQFEEISEQEYKDDICVQLIQTSSEESSKVDRREEGEKWSKKNYVVFQKI